MAGLLFMVNKREIWRKSDLMSVVKRNVAAVLLQMYPIHSEKMCWFIVAGKACNISLFCTCGLHKTRVDSFEYS
jgi:hypothetical protein